MRMYLIKNLDLAVKQNFSLSIVLKQGLKKVYVIYCQPLLLEQWFLTFFVPWIPTNSKKLPRTPTVSMRAICRPLSPYKSDLNGYNTLVL